MDQSITRDPRIDKGITWVLNITVIVMVGIGSWFLSDLSRGISDLRISVSKLETQVAINAVGIGSIQRIRDDLDQHIKQNGHQINSILIDAIQKKIEKIESRIEHEGYAKKINSQN